MADLSGDPGDTIEVDFEVTNTGDIGGTQDIFLVADDGTRTNVDRIDGLTLDTGGSSTGTLVWTEAPQGAYELCVESDDTSACISVALFDIPSGGLLHQHLGGSGITEDTTVTAWDDQFGDLGLSGAAQQTVSDALDGEVAVRFDGSQVLGGSRQATVSPPYTYYVVMRWQSIPGGNSYAADASNSSRTAAIFTSGSNWKLVDTDINSYGSGTSLDTDYHLVQVEVDTGSTARLILDGSQILESTNFSTGSLEGVSIGGYGGSGGTDGGQIDVVESLYYDADDADYSQTAVEDYMAEKYPTLSL